MLLAHGIWSVLAVSAQLQLVNMRQRTIASKESKAQLYMQPAAAPNAAAAPAMRPPLAKQQQYDTLCAYGACADTQMP